MTLIEYFATYDWQMVMMTILAWFLLFGLLTGFHYDEARRRKRIVLGAIVATIGVTWATFFPYIVILERTQ